MYLPNFTDEVANLRDAVASIINIFAKDCICCQSIFAKSRLNYLKLQNREQVPIQNYRQIKPRLTYIEYQDGWSENLGKRKSTHAAKPQLT